MKVSTGISSKCSLFLLRAQFVQSCDRLLSIYIMFTILILILTYFVNCSWVATRWQQCSTHLHTDSTQNNTVNHKNNTNNNKNNVIKYKKTINSNNNTINKNNTINYRTTQLTIEQQN
jgi:hypothetical protein